MKKDRLNNGEFRRL